MNLKNLLKNMYADPAIHNEYARVTEKEKTPGHYATHDMTHVNRVIGYSEQVARQLRLPEEDILAIKITALLHDIGCSSGFKGKGGHAERSFEWSTGYLQDKNINVDVRAKILTAIKEHSDNPTTLYGKVLMFADKIDLCEERILPEGLLVAGNRQYANIQSVDFGIENKSLEVTFKTNGNLDIDEMNKYYFTRKMLQSVEDLAVHFGLQHAVSLDGQAMQKQNNDGHWNDLYQKEVTTQYDSWDNYLREKVKLKHNFLKLIARNARLDKPIFRGGFGNWQGFCLLCFARLQGIRHGY